MTTARTLINDAFSEIGVKATGQTLSDAHLTVGLRKLNQMFDFWSGQSLMIYEEKEESFDLVSGQSSYSIGENSSPDFDTVRPVHILDGWFIRDDSGSYDYELRQIPLEQYRLISEKSTTGRPFEFAYNPTYPNGTLYFYYTPSASTMNVHIRTLKQITSLSTLSTSVSLPPGYEYAIVKNLAISLASGYGKNVSQALAVEASMAITTIKKKNIKRLEPVRLEVSGLSSDKYDGGY